MALFGCVLEQPDLASELNPEWFDDKRLSHLVEIVSRLLTSGKPVDPLTVLHEANDAKMTALVEDCRQQCHSSSSFQYWLEIVVKGAEKRRMEAAARTFLAKLPDSNGDLRGCIAELEISLAKPLKNERKTLVPKEIAERLNEHLEYRFNLEGKRSGLETGFSRLDEMLDGLQLSEMTILGARPGMGKTAIACNIVKHVCLTNKIPTLFFTLEMSAAALSRRLLSDFAWIPMQTLKSGRLSPEHFTKISAFDKLLKESPLYIKESLGGISVTEAASVIRRGVERKGIKLVVLDYLQKVKSANKHEKRTYEIGEASGTLVDAVKQSGVAFLCLAQLNRESEKDKGRAPRLSDLADSGQIERDADNVLLLHRQVTTDKTAATLFVAKQRDGENGSVKLHFDGQFCRFDDVINQPEPRPVINDE